MDLIHTLELAVKQKLVEQDLEAVADPQVSIEVEVPLQHPRHALSQTGRPAGATNRALQGSPQLAADQPPDVTASIGTVPTRPGAVIPVCHDHALAPARQSNADESLVAVNHRVEGLASAQLAGVQHLADRGAGLAEFRLRDAGAEQDPVERVASPNLML